MKLVSNIVFTRNRPLQLEGYLESLYRYFPAKLFQTCILYKVELFEQQYQQVFSRYPNCKVIIEKDFRTDFLSILGQVDTQYTLFGVDDVVYFDGVDFGQIDQAFRQFEGDIFGFSLRLSPANLIDSGDNISETSLGEDRVFSLDWTRGQTPTTRYPFELCATVYPTELVKRVISSTANKNPVIETLFAPNSVLIRTLGKAMKTRSILKKFGYFFNPNTLESWNCRWCRNNPERLPSKLFFQKLCASAVQVNLVNTATRNEFDDSGGFTVQLLAEKYKQGYKLDIDYVANQKPTGTHSGPEHFKLI